MSSKIKHDPSESKTKLLFKQTNWTFAVLYFKINAMKMLIEEP